jgi:hypothetical protein
MIDFQTRIKTHADGTSHDLNVCKLNAPNAKWCAQCFDHFGPAIDRVFVAQLAPKVTHFLVNGHDDDDRVRRQAAESFEEEFEICECGRHWEDCATRDDHASHHDRDSKCICAEFDDDDEEEEVLSPKAARYAHDENYLEGE